MNIKEGNEKYQAVFFDFDGVILDSVDVKTRAFAEIFRPYGPEVEKAAVDYHLANGGLSRFKKFEYIFKHHIKKPLSDLELQELGARFSELALAKVLQSPFIPGALETLKDLKRKKVPCFVVSGTPDKEIKHIVEEKGLADYFKEVHGSPREKAEILGDIVVRYGYETGKCLFIGDAMSDYEAAMKIGVKFLGIIKERGIKNAFPESVNYRYRVFIW